jgi:hypothetical protein
VPGRWLGLDAAKLDQFLVTFSGGPRSCQGIKCIVSFLCFPEASQSHCFDSLAYCEPHPGIAHLFRRRFELRVDESRCDLSHDLRSLADSCADSCPCKTAQSRLEGTFLILLHWRPSACLLFSTIFLTSTVNASCQSTVARVSFSIMVSLIFPNA